MMRYSLLFFVLAQTAALVAGCAELSDGITSAAYPDADTVTVDDREEMEYFPDGTYRSVEEIWTKALTEAGRRELLTTSLGYSRRYGTAKIAEVAIFGEDGVRRPVDLEGLVKESTDNSSTAVNIYDPLDRQIACTIPGVKVGDTVYVRKERSTFAARCQDQWATISVFEDFAPVVRASLRVKCPKELPICRAAVRNPLGNVVSSAVTNDDGSVVLDWCATNSPQAFWEPSMPTPYKQLQHVALSTAADWREMSRWYWELCAPHLAKTNAAMVAKVAELREKVGVGGERGSTCPHGGVENDPLLKEVFRFVSQEIRYMGLTMEDTSPGYAPHDVDITFDKRYGVCRDKAGLLVAMLRLAGFKAYPVLIMAGSSKMDPDVPSPYFNHAIVAVERGGGVEGEDVGVVGEGVGVVGEGVVGRLFSFVYAREIAVAAIAFLVLFIVPWLFVKDGFAAVPIMMKNAAHHADFVLRTADFGFIQLWRAVRVALGQGVGEPWAGMYLVGRLSQLFGLVALVFGARRRDYLLLVGGMLFAAGNMYYYAALYLFPVLLMSDEVGLARDSLRASPFASAAVSLVLWFAILCPLQLMLLGHSANANLCNSALLALMLLRMADKRTERGRYAFDP